MEAGLGSKLDVMLALAALGIKEEFRQLDGRVILQLHK
jgi:hypothetical protein